MNLKKVAPLVIALILGLLAAKMALNLVSNKQSSIKPEAKRPQVVIAKQNVEAGEPLTDDNVQLGEISSDAVSDNVFRNVNDVLGRVATVPLISGQAITTNLLAPKGAPNGLAAVIPPGFRAMTLEINEFSGVAGYIGAGCHVDVILSMRNEQTGQSMARTIVQDVKVAAVGMRHNPQDPPDAGRSVTVLVTPQQAEVLELASANGRPRLTLRNTNDLTPVQSQGVSIADIRGGGDPNKEDALRKITTQAIQATAVAATTAPSEPATRPVWVEMWTVKVINGGQQQEVQFPTHPGESEASSPFILDPGTPYGR